MPKNLKHNLQGKVISRIYTTKCSWCELGIDTDPRHICAKCHDAFKKLLQSYRWGRFRSYLLHLPEYGFCWECKKTTGIVRSGCIIDHIKPWSKMPSLFWEQSNLQSLCHTCHTRKTLIDGSFITSNYGWGKHR